MPGLESLPEAIAEAPHPLQPDELAWEEEELSDEAALSIVLQDADSAQKYLQSKSLVTSMDQADDLYRGYVRPRQWANGKARSNLSMPIVLEAIEKILPALHSTLWQNGKEPFELRGLGRARPEAVRAKGKLLKWAIKNADLKEEMRLTMKTALQYGFVVGGYGWEQSTRTKRHFKKDDAGNVVPDHEEVSVSKPVYEALDLRCVLVDPSVKTQDVSKGKFVIKQIKLTPYDLDEMRDDPTYKNIPTREELAVIMANNNEPAHDSLLANKSNVFRDLQAERDFNKVSADPLLQDLEYLEGWYHDRVIGVLQRKIVIRNEKNEFGKLPFRSCAFVDVLGSAWGFGVAKLLSGEQRFQTGVRNSHVDAIALTLNPVFQLLKGVGAGTQQISLSPGKVLTESGELKPLIQPNISAEANAAIESSEARSYRRVGAEGGSNMPTQAMRTAEGIQSFQGDVIQRLQYWLEIFIDMVFVPVLEAFLEMMEDHMSPDEINEILSEEEGKAYQGDILDVYNASVNIEVLAGTKMVQRQAAAQIVPMLIQLINQQPVQDSLNLQGKKFNYGELIDEYVEVMGWDLDSLIVDQTPEDRQRAAMTNQAAVKAQAAAMLQQQKHQNDMDLVNEKGTVQAGVAVVKQAAKAHIDQALEMMNPGEPGGSSY